MENPDKQYRKRLGGLTKGKLQLFETLEVH